MGYRENGYLEIRHCAFLWWLRSRIVHPKYLILCCLAAITAVRTNSNRSASVPVTSGMKIWTRSEALLFASTWACCVAGKRVDYCPFVSEIHNTANFLPRSLLLIEVAGTLGEQLSLRTLEGLFRCLLRAHRYQLGWFGRYKASAATSQDTTNKCFNVQTVRCDNLNCI